MYAEEYLPDDAVFDDEMDVSIDETSSMDTNDRDRHKRHELYKRSDPDYYSFKIRKYNEDGDLLLQKIEIYSSPIVGYIRHALTGVREPHRVGSKYEDLYFRVKDVGLYTKTETHQEPRKLFYRNPEEFERHQFGKVSPEIKQAWHEKYMRARALLIE
jgi:hypothetical protein